MKKIKPTLITAIISFLLLSSCQQGEDEVILLPSGYKGYVVILYSQTNGNEQKYHKGQRIYNIPVSGILKTKFSENHGYTAIPRFYYGKIDPYNSISFFAKSEDCKCNTVMASGGSAGKAYKTNDDYIEFKTYFIGNKKDIAKAFEDVEKLDITKL